MPPSTIIGDTGSGSAAAVTPPPTKAVTPPGKTPALVAKAAPNVGGSAREVAPPRDRSSHSGGGDGGNLFGTEDPGSRRPTGLGGSSTPEPVKPPTNVVITPTPTPTPTKGGSTEGPQDPYGTPAPAGGDPGDGASPDKKAEFYANLGAQQLGSGDTAGAAASFKKALELDAKNVNAVTGMGEIALRQGLFGDAIAHLKKAAKLAPKSSRIYTLLGEAYLNSGQHAPAADNFKKALQLDPDNARARDGYNEASSKAPPPEDDR